MIENMAEFIGEALAAILNWFGNIDLGPISQAFETMAPYIRTAGFFLPMHTIAQIFAIIMILFWITLIIRIIKTIWSILPVL